MKRSIIIMAAIMLLALPMTGCVTNDAPDQTVTPLLTEIANLKNLVASHTADIAKLKEDVARKADSSRVDSLATSIGQQSGSQDYYTKAEVTAMINGLKSDQSWIKSVSSNNGTPSTGGISVTLDKTQLYSTSAETGNKDISATVKNNSGAGKQITLYLSLTPASPIEDTKIDVCNAKSTLTGFNSYVEGTKQHTLDVATITTKVVWVVPSFYLENGSEKPIWLNFDVKTLETATWTIGLKAVDL